MDPSRRAWTSRIGESAFGDVALSGYDGRAALAQHGDAAITGDREASMKRWLSTMAAFAVAVAMGSAATALAQTP
jgi:hypothetical protein